MQKSGKFIIPSLIILAIAFFIIGKFTAKQATAPTKQVVNLSNKTDPSTTRLFFAGDMMLSRNVAAKIYKASDPSLPYKHVREEISSADIAFANLESPFNTVGNHSVQNSMVFNADPTFVSGLTDAGFDILSTANNHSFDQGVKGVITTLATLESANILPIGTGKDCHNGKTLERNGVKFGFLAYSYTGYNDGGKNPNPQVCDANDLSKVEQDIQKLKLKADLIIVSVHAGTEYKLEPNQMQINFAHSAIDAGADLIIGHHPHWVETIEEYHGKWIFYSLGNFVFDQMWSQETREGLTVEISLSGKNISKIELKPVIIEDYNAPRWADKTESEKILKALGLTNPVLVDKN